MTEASASSPRREPVVGTLAPSSDDSSALHRLPPAPRRGRWLLAGLAIAAGLAAVVMAWRTQRPPEPLPPAASAAPPPAAPTPAIEPASRYPIERLEPPPPSATQSPLPSLADSDALLQDRLSGVAGLERMLMTPNIVRRIVATIDNLPRAGIAAQVMAVRPAEGAFIVDADDGRVSIGRANSLRYAPYLAVVKTLDTSQLVALYVRYYPLFQEAYRDLGYPNGYFNDRVVDVIDHLLATPEPGEPVMLVQPRVLYEFANPDLEARSAGQKALMRMGADNARAAKAKLREIRAAVTRDAASR